MLSGHSEIEEINFDSVVRVLANDEGLHQKYSCVLGEEGRGSLKELVS